MEKVFSNIRAYILSGVILLLCVWGGISTTKLLFARKHISRLEQELGQLRTELYSAENRECELTETLSIIRDSTERTTELLNKSGNTIQNIRKEIQILEDYFNNINKLTGTFNNTDNK